MKSFPQENKIYASIINHCLELENKKRYDGNGKILAKTISSLVAVGFLSTDQLKVYNALTDQHKSVKEISVASRLSIIKTSIQLREIYRKTQLISFKKNDGTKLWFKYSI